jgi:molybdopterin synthase catalytic subunit
MSQPPPSTEPSDLRVTILLFAGLREQMGTGQMERRVPQGTTVQALYHSIVPVGPAGRIPVMFAVDEAYAAPTTILHDGAEVAFLPPLGGG